MTVDEKIDKYNITGKLVRFQRRLAKGDIVKPQTGYINSYSQNFVLFHEELDFKPFDISIFPKSQITSLRSSKKEKIFHEIIKTGNLMSEFEYNNSINLSNWESIFNSLKSLNTLIIVECEYYENKFDWEFAMGKIMQVFQNHFTFRSFNVYGKWDEKEVEYPYNELTLVRFNGRYSLLWEKYLIKKKKMI